MRLSTLLHRWLFASIAPQRLAAMRVFLCAYILIYLLSSVLPLTATAHYAAQSFEPVGPVQLLSRPLSSSSVWVLWLLCVGAGFLSLVGVWFRWMGPIFALLVLWVTSYRNSWGMLFHTENLFTLHLLVLSLSPAGDVWARRPSPDKGLVERRAHSGAYGWPLKAMCVISVLVYCLAGVAKLKAVGLDWGHGDQLRAHIAYDAVRKMEFGLLYSPLSVWMVKQEWLFAPLAWLTLAFELGAPLALLGRSWARAWALTAWAFHAGVAAAMLIVFAYPLSGIAFLPFFPVERVAAKVCGGSRSLWSWALQGK